MSLAPRVLDRKWRGRSRGALIRTWRLSRCPRAFSAMGRGGTSAQEAVSGEQSPICAREMSSHSSTASGDRGSRPGGHRGSTCGRAQRSKRGKSTRRRLREFALRVVSHNAQSLRQPEAIEVVINHMRRHKIHVYAMQETWWGGTRVLCNQDHTILNANEEGATRRGVGFVLSPDATRAWDATGRAQRTRGARAAAVRLQFVDGAGRTVGVCCVCGYRPTTAASTAEHDAFTADLDHVMEFAHATDMVIVAMDGNGAVGVANRADDEPALGAFGIPHRNASGMRLLEFMRSREMCSATSFFDAGSTSVKLRRRRDKRRNASRGGGRRTRSRRWARKQRQRERGQCEHSRRRQRSAGESTA